MSSDLRWPRHGVPGKRYAPSPVRYGPELRTLRESYATLSPREREVMMLVVSGRLNKEVGGELGIGEITVKAHRGRVMRKMKAPSLAELVTMATRLRIGERPRP